jgi:hypothetical protein
MPRRAQAHVPTMLSWREGADGGARQTAWMTRGDVCVRVAAKPRNGRTPAEFNQALTANELNPLSPVWQV